MTEYITGFTLSPIVIIFVQNMPSKYYLITHNLLISMILIKYVWQRCM